MTVGIKMVRAKEARRRRPGFVAVCVIGVVLAEKARAGLPYFVSFGIIVAVGIPSETGTAFANFVSLAVVMDNLTEKAFPAVSFFSHQW